MKTEFMDIRSASIAKALREKKAMWSNPLWRLNSSLPLKGRIRSIAEHSSVKHACARLISIINCLIVSWFNANPHFYRIMMPGLGSLFKQ